MEINPKKMNAYSIGMFSHGSGSTRSEGLMIPWEVRPLLNKSYDMAASCQWPTPLAR